MKSEQKQQKPAGLPTLRHLKLFLCGIVAVGCIAITAISYSTGAGALGHPLLGIAIVMLMVIAMLAIITATLDKDWLMKLTNSQELEYQKLLSEATEGLYENVYELDITHNRAGSEGTKAYFVSLGISGDTPYKEALKVIAKKQIKPEFISGYLETFSPENVLQAFHNGLSDLYYDFMISSDGGDYYWMRIRARIFFWESDRSVRMITYRQNIDEDKKREQEMLILAQSDALTGLYNKSATVEFVNEALKQPAASGCVYALLMADIDYFKTVNDSFGHAIGDEVIQTFASTLKDHFRASDICGRIGGDEFVVFLRDTSGVEWLEHQMRSLLDELHWEMTGSGRSCEISASIGIALSPQAGKDFNTLYRNADTALYLSKEKGRNTFTIYGQPKAAADN